MDDYEIEQLQLRVEQLRLEHSDLDAVIKKLYESPPVNELQLQRLKKRKLALKDEILRIENQLVPDILA